MTPESRPPVPHSARSMLARPALPPRASSDGRDPEQIMRDIADTRLRIGRTLDVLQRKLAPASLAREAADAVKAALTQRRTVPRVVDDLARPARADGALSASGGDDARVGPKKVLDVLADAAVNAIAAAVEETLAPAPPPCPPAPPGPRRRRRSRRD